MTQISQFIAVIILSLLVAGLTIGSLVGYVTFQTGLSRRELEIVYPITSCDSLTQIDLTDVGGNKSSITEAHETMSNNITVCSVKGTLEPAVNFRVLLPLNTWTQRYLQVGCSGLCGSITLRSGASDGCQLLMNGGFAMAATDMGHSFADNSSWGLDTQKRVDFAYRAQHITSRAVRKIIRKFYGQSERYSYFNGCSDGGREALMEAQRYPGDFDGIIAGAPAMLFQVQNTIYHAWQYRSNTDENNKVILLSAKLPILHQAVLDECDILDGVKDDLISNPAACKFDPRSIQCPANTTKATKCLTVAEVDVVRKLYTGPQDSQTGAYLTPGQPLYGSEIQWRGVFVSDSPDQLFLSGRVPLPILRYLAFTTPMPHLTMKDVSFTHETVDALRPRHPLFDASNTKLQAFAATGRKLIIWHGMADPHISPSCTEEYYNALLRDLGQEQVSNFVRFYLLPGMGHCAGGQGLNSVDFLTAMVAWVEEGKAPDEIMASNTGKPSSFGQFIDAASGMPRGPGLGSGSGPGPGRPQPMDASPKLPNMTRPIYPYPFVSRYTGEGDIYNGTNWKKGSREDYIATRKWYGDDFIGRYDFVNQ